MSLREDICQRSYIEMVCMLGAGERRENRLEAWPQDWHWSTGDMPTAEIVKPLSCVNRSVESWLRGAVVPHGWLVLPRVWPSLLSTHWMCPQEGKDGDKSFSNYNLRRTMKKIRLFSLETKGFIMEEWDEVLSNNWKAVLKKAQTYFVWLGRAVTLVQVKEWWIWAPYK